MRVELGLPVSGRAVEGVVAVVGEMLSGDVLLSGLFGRRQRYGPRTILLSMISPLHGGLHIRVGVGVVVCYQTDSRSKDRRVVGATCGAE